MLNNGEREREREREDERRSFTFFVDVGWAEGSLMVGWW